MQREHMTVMADVPKLLPCPFCGGSDIHEDFRLRNNHSVVFCDDCSAEISHEGSGSDARTAWNRRHASDVPKDIMEAARAVGHYLNPRCSGDCGHGPGGDGPRYHSLRCDRATSEVAAALLSERERRTAQGVTPEIVETMCSSPIIEALTPTVYEMSACQTVQDEYNLMKQRIRKAFAAPSLSTSAGGGE